MAVEQEHTDESLIKAVIEGDNEAFSFLVIRYKKKIFGMAYRFTQDYDELDDICQDVFIKVFDNLKKFRGDAPFEHWITKIAIHTCYDALKKKQRHTNRMMDIEDLPIRDTSIEAKQSAEEATDFLMWAMSHLKAEERMIITLLELEEKSVKETAALTGWSESNVKVRAHRARLALKKVLEANNERSL
ncbi:MAG: RNA polymerase sigma factor [Desulfuromonadales bacterium]|nr:RNA polymerase sigma factor [Desulfuromonadales bacterium]